MRRSLADRAAPVVFVASIAALATGYGVVSSWWGWFPAPQIGLAHRTMLDMQRNWRNDLALEPTRHLVPPADPARGTADGGLRVRRPGAAEPGHTVVAGLSADQDAAFHMATLYDGEGRAIHRWPIRYEALDPDGRQAQNVMLHGMEVFPDGSLAVTFDGGRALGRIDACGEPLWVVNEDYHHAVTDDGQGGLIAWRAEAIFRVDIDTGEETEILDFRRDVIAADGGAQRGYFDIRTNTGEDDPGAKPLVYLEDPFHPNDVEALRPEMADAFPGFEAGDLLISLRELNMIAVVDPETGRLRWWRHGPWMKQHDPDFQPDGTITVYDNATGTGASAIRRVDPVTDEVTTLFEGSAETPFYSWRRGKHQVLPGGDVLLTEPEHGRVLEVDAQGRVVWERDMVWDEQRNLIVTEARHLPEGFFADGLPSCASGADGEETAAVVAPPEGAGRGG